MQSVIFAGKPVLVPFKKGTSWVVFHREDIPTSDINISAHQQGHIHIKHVAHPKGNTFAPSVEEQAAAVRTRNSVNDFFDTGNHTSGHESAPMQRTTEYDDLKKRPATFVASKTSSRSFLAAENRKKPSLKFSLIQNCQVQHFYDIFAEVVKIFPAQFGTYEVYVTDYTANELLFNYPSPDEQDDDFSRAGDTFGYMPMPKREWPGPYGSMVLKIEVKEPHARVVRDIMKEGEIYFFANVRIKMSNQNKMEGNLWPDRMFPDKVQIHKAAYGDKVKAEEVRMRKEQYWKLKAPAALRSNPISGLSKGQRKNRKKKEKKAAVAQEGKEDIESAQGDDHDQTAQPTNKRRKVQNAEPEHTTNKHIRCISKSHLRPISLHKLLEAKRFIKTPSGEEQAVPFYNQNVQSIVRVIDHHPMTLEEFSSHTSVPIDSHSSIQRRQWSFDLLVEDADPSLDETEKKQMWLHVNNKDAEFLLNLKAAE